MKKNILILLAGIIIGISATVMAGSYNARQIAFTPTDNTWNVSTVEGALDNIKQTDKTEIANLQSSISNKDLTIEEKNNTIASLNDRILELSQYDQCVVGSFNCTGGCNNSTGMRINNLNFNPKFFVAIKTDNNNIHYFNKDVDSTNGYSTSHTYLGVFVDPISQLETFDNGLILHNWSAVNGYQGTFNYIACK